jgi:hypothetical protein
VKLSVSISEDDVEFIDHYASEHGVDSRSGVVQRALSVLRAIELGAEYAAAWSEWHQPDAEAWDSAIADGIN